MLGGNACWLKNKAKSELGIRHAAEYDNQRYYFMRQVHTRVNGELTALHTMEIIKTFHPKYWCIENPQKSML
jgi:hypothetical protein